MRRTLRWMTSSKNSVLTVGKRRKWTEVVSPSNNEGGKNGLRRR